MLANKLYVKFVINLLASIYTWIKSVKVKFLSYNSNSVIVRIKTGVKSSNFNPCHAEPGYTLPL